MNRAAWVVIAALLWAGDAYARELPPLRAGATLESVLGALNARGHRIVFSSALVTPAMTLQAPPRATRIDELLTEILAPWRLRAVPAGNGDWLIVAAPAPEPATSMEDSPSVEPELQTIDVTASRYALATPGSATVFLDRKGVEQIPHLADDAVRMLKVMPGVTGGDFSAALNIRGGRREETLLRIDGAEIHNGFHFRDLDGALSVLDTHLVESVDFTTGGMTADVGDYLSGVVDMRTRRPRDGDPYRHAAGISFVSAYGRTGGAFAQGRGAWLASARRGYLDVVMERVQDEDERITPRYTDVFASLYYDLGPRTTWSAHVLAGEDELVLTSRDEDEIDSAGDGRATHAWVTVNHGIGALESHTLLSLSTVEQWRDARGAEEERWGDVSADFRFRFLDLRSDWSWRLDDRQVLEFGLNAGRSRAAYDYALSGEIVAPLAFLAPRQFAYAHDLDVRGEKHGIHAAWRQRVAGDLIVEAGARWDSYGYPGRRFTATSPRLNAVVGIGGRGELRAAWGVMHQPHGVHQLQVEDDVTTFFPPERVVQSVLGYLHRFDHGLSARVDVYSKDYSRLRARFENALDPVQLIPEGAVDRVRIDAPRALARGVELTVRREAERGLSGWASLAFARAEDEVRGEGRAPRAWEQRRSLSLGASWSGARWNLNLAGLYHSGTPTTSLRRTTFTGPDGEAIPGLAPGPRNRARLGPYARVDLRASRSVPIRAGRFSCYLEVTNLLNRENPCCMDAFYIDDGSDARRAGIEQSYWLPMLPSFGFEFEF